MTDFRLGRRQAIAGLACGAGALAFGLEAAHDVRATSGGVPLPNRRLVLVMTPNGTQQANFWPWESRGFNSPILAPLLDVPALARHTTAVRGVFHVRDQNGTNSNEHDIGFIRMFTGEKLLSLGGAPWGGAASIDQVLGKKWGVDPLNLAVLSSTIEPLPKPGFNHRRSFSYVAPGVLRYPYLDPYDAYSQLFGSPEDSTPEARRRLLARKRVLDAPREDLGDLQARLGKVEKAKLDLHAGATTDLERRLGKLASPHPTSCGAKPKRPRHYREEAPSLLVTDESANPELTSAMTDLIAGAFACNLTRVATLQLAYGGGRWLFDWEGVHKDIHTNLAHLDTKDEGDDPEVTRLLVKVHRWYASQIADLARKLDAIPEGNGTVLDNTLIVWVSEIGRGDHSMENIPVVLVGGAGGAIRGGRLLDGEPQTFQRVGCTILRAMGEQADGFGDAPTCGPLSGVLA